MRKTSLAMAHGLVVLAWAAAGSAQAADAGAEGAAGTGAEASASAPADAPEAAPGTDAEASTPGAEPAASPASDAAAPPFMDRFVPSGMFGEFGLFLGVLAPSKDHNFHNEFGDYQKLGAAAFDFGLRAAFFPVPYVGAELEGALMPTSTADGQGATLWTVRAQGIVQASFWRLSPFLVLGGGRMGVLSDPLEDDADPLVHFGAGAKLGINDRVLIRVDLRDNLTQKNAAHEGALGHHAEVLVGLGYRIPPTAGSAAPPAAPTDTDGDGFADADDTCVEEPGIAPDGCPAADADDDGFLDANDRCPDQRGVAPHGCPPVDTDGDGYFDDTDECPEVAGVAPRGCPTPDSDGDGLDDAVDRCKDAPETVNSFEDDDGCPDELPQAVQEFTGAIQGIEFDTGKSTIAKASYPTLDQAVAVLVKYPKLRLEIAGHTDNVGAPAANLALSQARSASVKDYFVAKGIDAARLETVGYGQDRPVVSNDTVEGRKKNRRIEFRLLP